ncbi:hypothetical protein PsorP6_002524 [Peronosclerospora sorghi]|uniref:Uncharacterized protein n=1 Tax=Peronosclerospora sorghi TaxID=230839 RepID=A0ACC0WY07_9STRA|nr:hypothetical protein PsorP6_002524 [Peronosclerospora sorghi]
MVCTMTFYGHYLPQSAEQPFIIRCAPTNLCVNANRCHFVFTRNSWATVQKAKILRSVSFSSTVFVSRVFTCASVILLVVVYPSSKVARQYNEAI